MNTQKYKERLASLKASNPIAVREFNYKDSKRDKVKCKICQEDLLVASGEDGHMHRQCRKLRHNKNK